MRQIVVLIPAYEPGEKLAETLLELSFAGVDAVVVDDGSGADWAVLFSQASKIAHLITHAENRGKGAALKTGLEYIRKSYPADAVVVTADADGQHLTADILSTARFACENPGALILGVRDFGAGTPLRSRFGNIITRRVFSASTGVKVSDTQTGLRAFSADMIPLLLSVGGERYEYEMNVLLECAGKHIPIREIPIKTVYFSNNSASHFHPLRDSFLIYRELLKFAASSLTGFVVDYGLYSLLVSVTGSLGAISAPLSNICARIVSASVNFTLNRQLVFRHKGHFWRDAAMYFALAGCILAANTLLLAFLVNTLGWNKYLVKIITEITFFTISWLVQKFIIFRRGHSMAGLPAGERSAPSHEKGPSL